MLIQGDRRVDWREVFVRRVGPGPTGETRVFEGGTMIIFDGDPLAAKLDLPVDHVPGRSQDAEGLTHLHGGGGPICESTALIGNSVIYGTTDFPVDCSVCQIIECAAVHLRESVARRMVHEQAKVG